MPTHDKQSPKTLAVALHLSGPSSTFPGSSAPASAEPVLQGELHHTETRQVQRLFFSLFVTNVICGITNEEKALHLPRETLEDSWSIFSHVAKEHATAVGRIHI